MKQATLAPICLFVYKRLDTTKEVIASLQKNKLAAKSSLHIFSDAAGKERDAVAVSEVRSFIRGIEGFRSVTMHMAKENKGLAKSIISGVTEIIGKENKIIVLEDDLVVSDNFLDFMNAALNRYENNDQVFSVAGYTVPIQKEEETDVYFTKRASCWGWGTWKDRWDNIDWTVSDFAKFEHDSAAQKRFNQMGSDMTGMLKKQMRGEINSWAIRWTYNQFKRDTYTVFPIVSKVSNEGFSNKDATHTSKIYQSRFSTFLDTSGKIEFNFTEPALSPKILKQFTDTYSIKTRFLYKLKSMLS